MLNKDDRFIIANYHYVEDPKSNWRGIHPCSIEEFERQIKFLSKNFEIVSVGRVYDCAKNDSNGKFCAITFDDGLKGQYNNATPILKKYSVAGIFFPITSTFEGRLPSTHKIHVLLSHSSSLELIDTFHKFIGEFYSDLENAYIIPKDKRLFERRKHEDLLTANFKETMISLPEDIKGRFLRYCFKRLHLDEKKISEEIFMSKDDVVNLCNQNMEIGSHSHGHYSMSATGIDFLKKDIQISKDILSNLLSKDIDTFSYSHGHYTDFGIKVLKDMGFKNAVTIEPRSVTKEDNAFLLPRYDANDIRDFINKIDN